MWLFTTVGFFSVTQPRHRLDSELPEGTLQVRARVYEDLEALRERYLPELTETIHIPGRDYPYRGYISKEHFANAMTRIVNDLTYSNFKDEVKHEQGKDRADLYMSVWSVMYQAEKKLEDKREDRERREAKKRAAPLLPFEREANRQYQQEVAAWRNHQTRAEDEFDRQLREELEEREREQEARIEAMKRTNSGSRYDDDFDDLSGYEDLTAEIMDMPGMHVFAEDLFEEEHPDVMWRDRDAVPPASEFASTWEDEPKRDKKKRKKRKKNRR